MSADLPAVGTMQASDGRSLGVPSESATSSRARHARLVATALQSLLADSRTAGPRTPRQRNDEFSSSGIVTKSPASDRSTDRIMSGHVLPSMTESGNDPRPVSGIQADPKLCSVPSWGAEHFVLRAAGLEEPPHAVTLHR
jgi:hypothetical protein